MSKSRKSRLRYAARQLTPGSDESLIWDPVDDGNMKWLSRATGPSSKVPGNRFGIWLDGPGYQFAWYAADESELAYSTGLPMTLSEAKEQCEIANREGLDF